MAPRSFKSVITVTVASTMLAACASQPVNTKTGDVNVQYTFFYLDGSKLKEFPTEVTVVKRDATIKNVAAQVGINVLALALGGGGAGFQGFSKDGLKGTRIDDAVLRDNLKNPVSNEFTRNMQAKVSALVRLNDELSKKIFQKSILVAGGNFLLIYETLTGEDEHFHLKSDLVVYKHRENTNLFSFNPTAVVTCESASDGLLPLNQWAANDYQLVKTQLDAMLGACETKVLAGLAGLPDLLKD